MIVLVTDNLYLRAEKVMSISVNENSEYAPGFDMPVMVGRGRNKKPLKFYNIMIMYFPVSPPNSQFNGNWQHTNITVNSRKEKNATMRELIDQVRQQDPDNSMVDKLIEKFFCGDDEDDGSTEKVRSPRKKKRRS